jgi:lycopene cyclase domain-containing protein
MASVTYLLINLFTFIGPFAMGRESSVNYRAVWGLLAWTIPTVAFPFIIWDVMFTKEGVWSFNSHYYLGITLGQLPLEEIAFFFTIPFACLYLYEIVRRERLRRGSASPRTHRYVTMIVGAALLLATFSVFDQPYTAAVFCGGGASLLALGRKQYVTAFWITYLLHIVPFLLVNGVLTALPVVLYNSEDILGIRIWTIPVEDFLYSLILLYGNVTLREKFGSDINIPQG